MATVKQVPPFIAALKDRRQGDYCLDQRSILLVDRDREGTDPWVVLPGACRGLVLLSQTCDIVQHDTARTFVDVAPLVELPQGLAHDVLIGKSHKYAPINDTLTAQGLFADLNKVMCVSKELAATWTWTSAGFSRQQERRLGRILGNKRQRPAFDLDLQQFLAPLSAAVRDKKSLLGQRLNRLDEIRVNATDPDSSKKRRLTLYLVAAGEGDPASLADLIGTCRQLFLANEVFDPPHCELRTLDTLTTREYLNSDPLDLDYLTPQPT